MDGERALARDRHSPRPRGSPRDVLRRFAGQGLGLCVLGLAPGLPAALLVGRILESLLFGVGPADPPVTLLGVALLVSAAGLAAAHVPARRAASVDPVVCLGEEQEARSIASARRRRYRVAAPASVRPAGSAKQ